MYVVFDVRSPSLLLLAVTIATIPHVAFGVEKIIKYYFTLIAVLHELIE